VAAHFPPLVGSETGFFTEAVGDKKRFS